MLFTSIVLGSSVGAICLDGQRNPVPWTAEKELKKQDAVCRCPCPVAAGRSLVYFMLPLTEAKKNLVP
jgi:hypothetical protein